MPEVYQIKAGGKVHSIRANSPEEAADIADEIVGQRGFREVARTETRGAPLNDGKRFVRRLGENVADAVQGLGTMGRMAVESSYSPLSAGKNIETLGKGLYDSAVDTTSKWLGDIRGPDDEKPSIGSVLRKSISSVAGPYGSSKLRQMMEGRTPEALADVSFDAASTLVPEAFAGKARAMRAGAEAVDAAATGPVRSMAREVGLKPRSLFNPLSGVSGDMNTALPKLQRIADEELGVLGVDQPLPKEITTTQQLRKDIGRLKGERDARLGAEADVQKDFLRGEKEKALGEVSARQAAEEAAVRPDLEVLRRGKESAMDQVAGIRNAVRGKAGSSIGAEAGIADTAGARPISSASAGRQAGPTIRNSKNEARGRFGKALDDAEAPLMEQEIPREELIDVAAEYPDYYEGVPKMQQQILGGKEAGPNIPFKDVRKINKEMRYRQTDKNVGAASASADLEEAALGSLAKRSPEDVGRFVAAKKGYNEGFAGPYRRGAPGRALKSLKNELPQEVTNIPLDSVEQWSQLVDAVKPNPAAHSAVVSDVVFNRMGLNEGAGSFASSWRRAAPEVKTKLFGEGAPAMDRFLATIEELEGAAKDVRQVTKEAGADLSREVRRDFAGQARATKSAATEARTSLRSAGQSMRDEVSARFDKDIANVVPEKTGTTARLDTLETILEQTKPRGLEINPPYNIFARGLSLPFKAVEIMGNLLAGGNTKAALNFARAFEGFTKTGRPQALINASIMARRVDRRKKESEEAQQ